MLFLPGRSDTDLDTLATIASRLRRGGVFFAGGGQEGRAA
jgi:hypothetical protein